MNYRTIRNLEISRDELAQWAASHETDEVVALAIHAIADESRAAEQIWQDPTDAEWQHVQVAVSEYVDNGICDADDEYQWGEESFSL